MAVRPQVKRQFSQKLRYAILPWFTGWQCPPQPTPLQPTRWLLLVVMDASFIMNNVNANYAQILKAAFIVGALYLRRGAA